MRMGGFGDDSMKLLIAKKFVLSFEYGDDFIFLIKHWKIHNYIQRDRYKASNFRELLREVYLDENKAYSLTPGPDKTPCIQNGYNLDTQVRLGKSKGSVEEESIELEKENTLNNSFIQVGEIGDCKGEEQSSLPADRPEKSEAEINARRAELQKLMAWYEKNNLDPVNVRQMAAEEGITL